MYLLPYLQWVQYEYEYYCSSRPRKVHTHPAHGLIIITTRRYPPTSRARFLFHTEAESRARHVGRWQARAQGRISHSRYTGATPLLVLVLVLVLKIDVAVDRAGIPEHVRIGTASR